GLVHAASIDFGFDARGTAVVSVKLPKDYDPTRAKAFRDALDRARQRGAGQIATAQIPPLGGGFMGSSARRPEQAAEASIGTRINYVSSEYFQLLRIPVVAGERLADDAPST